MDDKCEECMFQDEATGSCTNDQVECVDNSAFVKALGPEAMFKALYMIIYNLGGEIDFAPGDLEKFDDTMKILPKYDPKSKRYVLETSHQPPQPSLIKVPRGISRKLGRKKIILCSPN